MTINNSLAKKEPKFSQFLENPKIKQLISQTIGNKKDQFVTAIIAAVAANPELQKCDHNSILSTAFIGAGLNLSPTPQLGHFYMIPFLRNRGRSNEARSASFVIGYKGLVQMAVRSGQYRNLDVFAIKEGELEYYNPFNGEISLNYIEDEEQREAAETIGFFATIEYLNGFKKILYWSKAKMQIHAARYSSAYKWDQKEGKKKSFWSNDFDQMGCKTMLRQILSKWGILSIEMEKAFLAEAEEEISEMKDITPEEPEEKDGERLDISHIEEEEINEEKIDDVLFT